MADSNIYVLVTSVSGLPLKPKWFDKASGNAKKAHDLAHWRLNKAGTKALLQGLYTDADVTKIKGDAACTVLTHAQALVEAALWDKEA